MAKQKKLRFELWKYSKGAQMTAIWWWTKVNTNYPPNSIFELQQNVKMHVQRGIRKTVIYMLLEYPRKYFSASFPRIRGRWIESIEEMHRSNCTKLKQWQFILWLWAPFAHILHIACAWNADICLSDDFIFVACVTFFVFVPYDQAKYDR